ncbi:scavenger receptor cysteine-rich domain superfamily protein-like isoform X2 [Anneissia japonica]|uniref:scavenger receptor cysteine-rich domain superfamily protein-like isoform X2 n=1 Tax=Anneissia japonica TaxID=1529436 RepID=UPI0014257A37|nr:scavenger receptor cysteine-rich domain superfamily protein-like isoform X2 [Anneissia japonica]
MIFTVVLFVVKLICCIGTEPKEGEVRLVDGTNQLKSEGRVDIFLDGEWGTICDDAWDIFDANVVCKQLGFESARAAYPNNSYPSGDSLPIHVRDVFCVGYEKSVYECLFHRTHLDRCAHSEDATLACNTLRLIGGENDAVGQVEALLPHSLRFCQDSFDKTSAENVCAELGYSSVEDYNCCVNTEMETTSLMEYATIECITSTDRKLCKLTNETCPSQNYASINCSIAPIRIIPVGSNPLEGRLEVLLDGTWGSVCSDLWNNKSAVVACRQLGNFALKPANALRFSGDVGINKNVAFENLCCIGDEQHIERCPIKSIGLDSPPCQMDNVGMVCTDIRLVGGRPGFSEGRVEVVSNRQWGNVCADSWTIQNADVVCRQLYDVPAYSIGDFGQGSNDVLMSKVDCVGDESSLTKCSYLRHTDDSNVCNTNMQAGVICQDLRLRSATNTLNVGQVEIMVDGKWGSICGHGWSIKEANIACRQLGHCSALRSSIGEHRLDVDRMHWTSISCLGNESMLRDCNYEIGNGPCYNFLFEADVTCIGRLSILVQTYM